jgi:PAS domain-containing protein
MVQRSEDSGGLSAILDLAQVMVRDLDGRITAWSSGSERLYGWSLSEAVGQISLWHPRQVNANAPASEQRAASALPADRRLSAARERHRAREFAATNSSIDLDQSHV